MPPSATVVRTEIFDYHETYLVKLYTTDPVAECGVDVIDDFDDGVRFDYPSCHAYPTDAGSSNPAQ